VERFGRRPFFRDYPQGFQIDAVELDEDFERAGFFYSPPPTPPPE